MTSTTPPHLLSINQLDRARILELLSVAGRLRDNPSTHPDLRRAVIGLLFFETSTRTRFGFAAAASRAGATPIALDEQRFRSDMSDAESLEDTVRVVSAYSDVLVLRHRDEGAPRRAAAVSKCPVVNAGNGADEHPTQTLIDLFAIQTRLGRLDDLRIGIVGDLAASRSAHSLALALGHFSPRELRLLHPSDAALPPPYLPSVLAPRTSVFRDGLSAEALADLDVLFAAGLPAGANSARRSDADRAAFAVTLRAVSKLPPSAIILCPLPRIDEISSDVDGDPRAAYFSPQSDDGIWIRMAVLCELCQTPSSALAPRSPRLPRRPA